MRLLYTFILFFHLYAKHYIECIQFGTDVVDKTKYPFFIMLGSPHICGGAIISYNPAYVLTAAHCMDVPVEQSKNQKASHFALYNDIQRENLIPVAIKDWVVHPNYNVSGTINVKYDTAIVRLAKPLKESPFVKRAALWPPSKVLPTAAEGEMVGFGYIDAEGRLAKTLQSIPLVITRFDAYNYIEARSNGESKIACHGDSGGPLIVPYSVESPQTNQTVIVPFVMGALTRIFGARDIGLNQLTCPVPLNQEVHSVAAQNTVVEAFTNAPYMLDWISSVSGISVANLTDPFAKLPSSLDESSDWDGSINSLDNSNKSITGSNWRIGAVTADASIVDTNATEHFGIAITAKTLVLDSEEAFSTSKSSHVQFSAELLSSCILLLILYL